MKKFYSFLPLFLTLFFLYPAGETEKKSALKVLYTSSLNGNLDGCSCRSSPRAGLVKRAHFLREMKNRENIILVDAGDILDVYPSEELSEEILAVYNELGYDAVGVGDQEFANGIEALLRYRLNSPLLSNNLAICPDESSCIFFSSSPLTLKKASHRIGIFSLLDPEVFNRFPEEVMKKIKLSPVADTARNIVGLLDQEGTVFKILLYHGSYDNAVKLTKKVKGIDIAVVGHEQRIIDANKIGGTILVSPGEEGNRIGVLELIMTDKGIDDYRNSFTSFKYEEDPDDPSVRERIERYREALRSKVKSGKS